MNFRSLRGALTRWYERAQRDLVWRRTRDPYAIWISEIMLQQTRVAAVIPYYQRFLEAFPDAAALAAAPESKVLAMWSGLGYYARARNLRKAAQRIATLEEFPRDYDSIRAIEGVGDYTAAAISSIAFGLPHAAVDGNVRRVIARLLGDSHANIREHADRLLDRRDPGRWNQALMELGATVCLPRDPHCAQCPLANFCIAHRQGTQKDLPLKLVKPAPVRLKRTLLWIRRRRRILLIPSPQVKGFWDLPGPFPGAQHGKIVGEFRHTIAHRHYKFVIREACAKTKPEGALWLTFGHFQKILLSTVTIKALRFLNPPAPAAS